MLREYWVTRAWRLLGELAAPPATTTEELRVARATPINLGDQMRLAWEDWLAKECARRPVLLVLEDIHWGDAPSVRFVDAALRHLRDQPFMVLALARKDVHDLFPSLWAERDLQEIRLAELPRRASERLVREVLGTEIPADRVARICERAGGNALYLEELIRAVVEGQTTAPSPTPCSPWCRPVCKGSRPKRVGCCARPASLARCSGLVAWRAWSAPTPRRKRCAAGSTSWRSGRS